MKGGTRPAVATVQIRVANAEKQTSFPRNRLAALRKWAWKRQGAIGLRAYANATRSYSFISPRSVNAMGCATLH
jgi:hypothetical protein